MSRTECRNDDGQDQKDEAGALVTLAEHHWEQAPMDRCDNDVRRCDAAGKKYCGTKEDRTRILRERIDERWSVAALRKLVRHEHLHCFYDEQREWQPPVDRARWQENQSNNDVCRSEAREDPSRHIDQASFIDTRWELHSSSHDNLSFGAFDSSPRQCPRH